MSGLKSGLGSVGTGLTKVGTGITDGVGTVGKGFKKGFSATAGLVGLGGSKSESIAKLKNHFETM